jgi:hypothetical protein
VPDTLLELIELGGNTGWLKQWWRSQQDAGAASR